MKKGYAAIVFAPTLIIVIAGILCWWLKTSFMYGYGMFTDGFSWSRK